MVQAARVDAQVTIPEKYRIPRLSRPTPEVFFEEYYLPARPVILTGAMDAWPCRRGWTLDHLQQAIGSRPHIFHYEEDQTLTMTVGEYLDIAFQPPPAAGYEGAFPAVPSPTEKLPYMRHFGPLDGLLEADYPLHSLFPPRDDLRFLSYLFCGVPTTKTNCHYDWSHNFVGVIRGQKHVTLLPPGAEKFLNVDDELRRMMSRGNCDYFTDPPTLRLDPGPPRPGDLRMHEHPVFRNSPTLYYSPLDEGDIVFFPPTGTTISTTWPPASPSPPRRASWIIFRPDFPWWRDAGMRAAGMRGYGRGTRDAGRRTRDAGHGRGPWARGGGRGPRTRATDAGRRTRNYVKKSPA